MDKAIGTSEAELERIVKDKWTNSFRPSYITAKGCMLPCYYPEFQKVIDDFEVFDSDIWICSFPRTGTTWTSEMAWLIANNCNYEKAKISMFDRIRFLDLCFLNYIRGNQKQQLPDSISDAFNYAKNQPHPRFIKTHLPFQLLPKQIQTGEKKPKIIYVCRNPLDTCVSYYYHAASIMFSGSLEEYCKLFLCDKVVYGPFWEHVLQFWKIRDQENILFLKYENMKRDLAKVIQETSAFLGKSVPDEEIRILQDHLSFESMKKNPAVSGGKALDFVKETGPKKSAFVRSGKVGGYKTEMPQHFIEIFESWMKSNLEGTGLNF